MCTTHPSLDLRKGVLSKSIMEEGGEAIQRELHKFSEKFGKTQLGKVVRTTGGNLRCKSVYHLSLPSWRDDHGQVSLGLCCATLLSLLYQQLCPRNL